MMRAFQLFLGLAASKRRWRKLNDNDEYRA